MNSAAGRPTPEDFTVRVGQDEIFFILNLKENLDQSEQLVSHALRYLELGWRPRAVSADDAADLGVDFSQPEELLYEQIGALQQSGYKINLGLPTSGLARLLVLEVHAQKGIAALDRWGEWRSTCWAHTEDGREQHYYYLPPGFTGPRTSILSESEIVVFGEGGLVLAPPSLAGESSLVWHWFAPPWESRPAVPGQAIWQFLKAAQVLPGQPDPKAVEELPSWEEIYQRIEPFNEIIRALVAPAVSFEQYYEKILDTALGFLIPDPTLMFGLLWHAPRGDLKECPQRWLYLQNLAASASNRGLGMPVPEQPACTRRVHPSLLAVKEYPEPLPTSPGFKPEARQSLTPGQSMPRTHDIDDPPEDGVIVERSRYEAMLLEMTELSNKAALLERRLAEQEARLASLTSSPQDNPSPNNGLRTEFRGARTSGTALRAENPQGRDSMSGQDVFREFLVQNPDLADPEKVRMLHFYLKNYIDINPENHGLSLTERLARAAKMVRDFLGM